MKSIVLWVTQSQTGIMQTPSYAKHPLGRTVALHVWTHVDIDIDYSASPNITVKLDGAVALDAFALDAMFAGGGNPNVSIGPAYYTANMVLATEAHFDNVLIVNE